MRVGIIALQHESNTFARTPTTYAHFENDHILTGGAIRDLMANAHHEVGGFFAGLTDEHFEAVPIFSARATPGGTIEQGTWQRLAAELMASLEQAGPLDGILAAPHGAAVAESVADADGEWLQGVRRHVGPDVPIVCTIDVHANVSPRMIEACNATIAYRTNPHVDQRERGLEAAGIMARILRDGAVAGQAFCAPSMAINIEAQCTDEDPCRRLCEAVEAVRGQPGVLSASLVLGFSYADVAEMGSSMIVVTDERHSDGRALAADLGGQMWRLRRELAGRMISIEQALDSIANEPGPVLLLDMGDNVGGGGPGDSTHIAHAMARRGMGGGLMTIHDPASVEAARAVGIHGRAPMRIGGRNDPLSGEPLETQAEVLSLFDGRFAESQVRHGGISRFDMGPTAVVRTQAGLTVMLTSQRLFPVSLGQWTQFGIDPRQFRVIVAKGVHAPVAAYRDICRRFLRVNTPGITTADMLSLTYQHRRRPMYPFELDAAFPGCEL